MKPRRNTADSDPELALAHRPSAASVEMNAWPRRTAPAPHSQPQLRMSDSGPPSAQLHSTRSSQTLQGGPLTPLSPHAQYFQQYKFDNKFDNKLDKLERDKEDAWRASASTYQHRQSTASSADGERPRRGSRRGSRPSPLPVPAVSADGEEMYYPLSPAPVRKADAASFADKTVHRLTRGSESEVLPPDDRNYPVPPFRTASASAVHDTASPHRIVHASTPGPPSIYWSDDNTSVAGTDTATIRTTATATNPSAFTFYRDLGEDSDSDGQGDDDAAQNRRQARNSRRLSRLMGMAGVVTNTAAAAAVGRAAAAAAAERSAAAASASAGDGSAITKPKPAISKPGRPTGNNSDDDLDLDERVGPTRRLEGRRTADLAFVNGCYIPPALRNGRPPGRVPVSAESERERERQRHLRNILGPEAPDRIPEKRPRRPPADGDERTGGHRAGRSRSRLDSTVVTDADELGHYRERFLTRARLWYIGLALVLVVAIAVGVGVGVGLQ